LTLLAQIWIGLGKAILEPGDLPSLPLSMSEQIYERYWCPRSEDITLDWDGYLPDPASDWGRTRNPSLVNLSEISEVPCLVLLGEAGMGKTTALEFARQQTYEQTKNSKDICLPLFRLGDYGSDTELCNAVFRNSAFQEWLSGKHKLYLFLDSLDEGLLSIKILVRILKREIESLPCDRLYFRITCRATEWAESLEEKLRKKWGERNVEVYTLAPLSRTNVVEAANREGIVSPDKFLREISEKNAVPLAIKPITLKFLINLYSQNKKLPNSQIELYELGCLQLCTEVNSDRLEAGWRGKLSETKRRMIAGRIAAAMIFSNRSSIWIGSDYGSVSDSDILLQELCFGKERIDDQEFYVNRDCIEEVLELTGLFSINRHSYRIEFSHRTYAEFLAAWYLKQQQIELQKILQLIIHSGDPDSRVVPQLHETASWLADMESDVLHEIVKTDPDVLLKTDVPTDAEVRASIVDNLLMQYEEGRLCNRSENSYCYYAKLKHARLVEQLRPYICDSTKQIDARDLAIDIAKACEVYELQKELANLAISPLEPIDLRASAANALIWIGDIDTQLSLKPLIITPLPEDEYDRLRGKILQALWPDGLNAHELFRALTPPKKRNYTGAYQLFANIKLAQELKPEDLVFALNWLKNKGPRIHSDPFEKLCDEILVKAWENFDFPGVPKSFAEVALMQWKYHEDLIPSYYALPPKLEIPFSNDENKRLKFVEQVVFFASSEEEKDLFLLTSSELTSKVLDPKDIVWLLQQLQDAENSKAHLIWAALVHWSFNKQQSEKYNSLILEAVHSNDALKRVFGFDIMPIKLHSDWAQSLKRKYYAPQSVENNSSKSSILSDSTFQRRVLESLNALERDSLNPWLELNSEIIGHSTRRNIDADWELNLTSFSAWQQLSDALKIKLLECAKNFTKCQARLNIEQSILEDDGFKQAFCRALLLVLKLNPSYLEEFTSEYWKIWAESIISVPGSHQRNEYYLRLIEILYSNAPRESLDVLEELIYRENEQYKSLFSIHSFKRCWDETLEDFLLEKFRDCSLTPRSVGQILDALLQKGSVKSRDLAKSIIVLLSSRDEIEAEKKSIVSRTFMEHSDSSSWPFLWNLIQEDTGFGRSVIERFACRCGLGMQFKLNLAESQLSEFYIWLVKQYPYQDDLDYSNAGIAHVISARENVSDLRDSVLQELKDKGSLQACFEIERLIKELPEIEWLRRTLIDAQANMRYKSWQPPTPEEFLQLIFDKDKYLVQNGNQLLEVLVGSLERLQLELQGETPAVRDLWDKVIRNSFRPLDENAFSDYIKRFLDRDLKSRGIIANREVELRRPYGSNPGERTDIHIDAVLKEPNGDAYDVITAIVEIKGCWHGEIKSAMKTQLVDRYLADNACQYGLYLIGWFNCQQWDSADSRKSKTPKMTLEEASAYFERQAEELTSSKRTVCTYVLNTALRRHAKLRLTSHQI
jgi:hypothetical protein